MIQLGNKVFSLKGKVLFNISGRIRIKYQGIRYISDEFDTLLREISDIYYVEQVQINSVTETILIKYNEFDSIDMISEILESVDHIVDKFSLDIYKNYIEQKKNESNEKYDSENESSKKLLARLVVNGAVILGTKLLSPLNSPLVNRPVYDKFTTLPAITSLALTSPLFRTSWDGLVETKRPNADFLTVTSIIASLLLGNSTSALTIIALSDIAEFMTAYTVERTRNSIKNLLSLEQDVTWKLNEDGNIEKCSVDRLKKDDRVVIHTGEKICVDGEVIDGEAIVDLSSVSGEYMPVIKKSKDKVYAGGIIKNGTITVKAEKVGDDTVISRIINLVENSATQQAPIQKYADKFSNYLVPLNLILSAVVYGVTKSTTKALNMLVIDYSCGIKLSTATAFSASINTAVKNGVLIKGGAFIEQLTLSDTIVLDKTGTITEGKPRIKDVYLANDNYTEKQIVELACAAEVSSSHPLSHCVLEYGKLLGVKTPRHGAIEAVVGRGTYTTVKGKIVRVGNLKFMTENGINPDRGAIEFAEGVTPIFISYGDEFLGVLGAYDKPRKNIKRSINMMRSNGINEVMILTGDMRKQAMEVANKVNADSYKAELLPEDKADQILKMKADGTGVIMVGDGINDAPALSYANVGISLGSKSTDVAIETSDIVINSDNPLMIPKVMELSGATMDIVKQNFALVIGINTIGLVLGATSNISVFLSAVMHNMSTIFVVGNSCRLLFNASLKGVN
ncbi:heavy metal translocating P-type ATPase [Peptostreptococcus porci]|uniref:heavy metal translocating P-type ATPase n=1 Tax=Peptostreptococcus porci TaxID=2652282 RepID=UPI0023F3E6E2|nr:cation-translocating P-type ATPase [Peptostreptococcus porci]MDD7183825.1 heavy metal translocating P-type ATPase [Peptostreptococcus porci]MDY4127942.1 heavy metal translocating P-type ATPase [Peptostreptococcus porci]